MTDGRKSQLRRLLLVVGAVALIAVVAGVATYGRGGSAHHVVAGQLATDPPAGPPSAGGTLHGKRPNIVFVLTDDLSMDLLRFMPQVQAMETRGMTFRNYFVSDSLCCPSRASIFTGNFPHDTGVWTNSGARGGMGAFVAHDDENKSFNLTLQRAGYRTAMMGKYINRYLDGPHTMPLPPTYVPPGWSEWDVGGWGYPEYDYRMNIDGHVHYFGHKPKDYLTSVITRRGVRFIDRSASAHKPFFLELATFTPHTPYVPAPRDAHKFPGLTAPHPPSFDQMPTHAPPWLASHPPLSARQIAHINWVFRRRVQDVQSVDRMITAVQQALQRHHLLRNTYVVFSSDNGLHTGEYRMMPGKLTAFDTDIHVPLVVDGPGIAHGSSTGAMSENTDLASTFTAMGGTSLSSDGVSLLPILHGSPPANWPNAILVEHHHPVPSLYDPDLQAPVSGNPPSYEAIRTKSFLYVEYVDGEREYYDLRTDPFELHNLAGSLSPTQRAQLHAELMRMENCHTSTTCWAAEHVANGA